MSKGFVPQSNVVMVMRELTWSLKECCHDVGGHIVGQDGENHSEHDAQQSLDEQADEGKQEHHKNHYHGDGLVAFIERTSMGSGEGVGKGEIGIKAHHRSIVQRVAIQERK